MSRVGKYPVALPAGTTVQVDGGAIKAKGKLGQLSLDLVDEIEASVEEGKLWIRPRSESKRARMMWGTYRALSQSMVTGVTEGFSKVLELHGVGYRPAVEGSNLKPTLGSRRAGRYE